MPLRTVIFILILSIIILVSCGRKATPLPTLLPIPTPTPSPPTAQIIYTRAIQEMGNLASFQASGRLQEKSEVVFLELRLVRPDNFLLDITEINEETEVTLTLLSLKGTNFMRSTESEEWFIPTGESGREIRFHRTAEIVETLLSEELKIDSSGWSFEGVENIGGVKTYHLGLTLSAAAMTSSVVANDFLNKGTLDLWIGAQDFLVYKMSFVDNINYHEVVFTLAEFDQITLELPLNSGLLEKVEADPVLGLRSIHKSFQENESIPTINQSVDLTEIPESAAGGFTTKEVISIIRGSFQENQSMPTIDESVDLPQTPEEVKIFLESLSGPDQACIRSTIGKEIYAELLMGSRMPTLEELLTASLCLPSAGGSEATID